MMSRAEVKRSQGWPKKLCQTEICEYDMRKRPVLEWHEDNIARLQIAVHNARVVHRCERFRDLVDWRQSFEDCETALSAQPGSQPGCRMRPAPDTRQDRKSGTRCGA